MLRAVGRVTLAALALGLLAYGCYLFHLGRDMERRYRAALTAEPVRVCVDLSKAGMYEGTFLQTYSWSHGEEILLRADPPLQSQEETKAALAGLSFRIRILDDAGEDVVTGEGAHELRPPQATRALGHDVPLLYFHPFPKGRYRFLLEVLEPAPRMAGRQQEVFAWYLCCGCEQGPVIAAQVIGTISVVLSLFAGGLAWWLRPRARSGTHTGAPSPGTGSVSTRFPL